MKKFILGIAGVVAFALIPLGASAMLPVVTPPTGVQCVAIAKTLSYQSRDSIGENGNVALLQYFLHAKGYLTATPTGYYGALTVQAVKAFQSENGISPTGTVGPITRAKIKTIACAQTNLVIPQVTLPPLPTSTPISAPPIDPCTGGAIFNNRTGERCSQNVGVPNVPQGPYTASNAGGIYTSGTPSITVLSPNGGESLTKNDTLTIKWQSTGGTTAYFYLTDASNPVGCRMGQAPANVGWMSINISTIDCSYLTQGILNYRVLAILDKSAPLVDNDFGTAHDYSDTPFVISPASQTSFTSMKITSPQENAVWTMGKTYAISWQGPMQQIILHSETSAEGMDPNRPDVSVVEFQKVPQVDGTINYTLASPVAPGYYNLQVVSGPLNLSDTIQKILVTQ